MFNMSIPGIDVGVDDDFIAGGIILFFNYYLI